MHLYTNNHPETTLKGLGFKNLNSAKDSVIKVEKYFNKLKKLQKIPGWTSTKTRPRKFISSKKLSNKYYQKQKFLRILGLNNRAKGMLNRVDKTKTKKISNAIDIFNSWLSTKKK